MKKKKSVLGLSMALLSAAMPLGALGQGMEGSGQEMVQSAWDLGEQDWSADYLQILEQMGEERTQYGFALVYVDEDLIPELVCYSGTEAGGCQIYTWRDGDTDLLQTHRLGFSYIEKKNLLCNSDGVQGAFFDIVYQIQDGKWVQVAEGGYSETTDGSGEAAGEAYCRWNGQDMDRTAYDAALKQVYDTAAAITSEYYIYEEMYSLLSAGQTLSAAHSYEIVRADVTWSQAAQECQARGGYLAAITSPEEMRQVSELVRQGGYGDCALWVGASRKDRPSYQWIAPEKEYDMMTASFWPCWMEGEPSYTGMTEGGWEEEEEYVTMFYFASQDQCYLNDVPDDILGAAPSYAGMVGYICEYE